MKHLFNKRWLLIISLFIYSSINAEELELIAKPIDDLHQTLLEAMQLEGADQYESRIDLLTPVISNHFYFQYISRIVTGREWKKLDAATQQNFVSLFQQLTIATYANRFDKFNNERFTTNSVEELKNNRFLVRTGLKTVDETVSLDYILQQENNNWKIINVIANGVSDLSLKRVEYSQIIKASGFAQLMEEMQTQIAAQIQ
ncbi:MAG: ABC transporter substrate-binding protein [Pseudomonadota bacterium]